MPECDRNDKGCKNMEKEEINPSVGMAAEIFQMCVGLEISYGIGTSSRDIRNL